MTYTTDQYEGLIAETITVTGANGDPVTAYFARPQPAPRSRSRRAKPLRKRLRMRCARPSGMACCPAVDCRI